jgi:hypothetical protein
MALPLGSDVEYVGVNGAGGVCVGKTATNKVGFFGTTAVVQPAPAVTVGTDIATVILELADLRAQLVALGLIAS